VTSDCPESAEGNSGIKPTNETSTSIFIYTLMRKKRNETDCSKTQAQVRETTHLSFTGKKCTAHNTITFLSKNNPNGMARVATHTNGMEEKEREVNCSFFYIKLSYKNPGEIVTRKSSFFT